MTDSVTPASKPGRNGSKPKGGANILDKFTAWRAANPDVPDAQYVLQSELEAGTCLLALIAVLRGVLKEIKDDPLGAQNLRALANRYQVAVRHGRAMAVFEAAVESGQYIEIAGIKILPAFTLKH